MIYDNNSAFSLHSWKQQINPPIYFKHATERQMQTIRSIFIFYKKLIIPSLMISLLLGLSGMAITHEFSLGFVGFSYIFFASLFHYFIYEIRNRNEYYFYFNMGLSRIVLWVLSSTISIIIGTIFMLL
ncbi:hypothetical protein DMA11_14750 [Marinilabiliaceae bacterium JC017]|nr:hypothetical protein DMA11_14750 [Marinilabiliaceae bacterium JC017]